MAKVSRQAHGFGCIFTTWGEVMRYVLIAVIGLACLTAAEPEKPAEEPAAGTEIVHPVDGALMVYVPSGWFIMGMNADEADRHAKSLGYKHYHDIAAEEWFPRRRVWVAG